ncbi:hypothetical protein CK203_059468 [Vitis vinifera]|uniref:Uncharacterized protein n=1 Tax=Vitis vinifera TaxID=29760 RepID=A0A438GBR9_VITVI|nr:hypothetical protein CK203_059468 [Vitis vinifera]
MGIRLSIFGLYFYAPDSYRVTFIPHLIQCFHIYRRVYLDRSGFTFESTQFDTIVPPPPPPSQSVPQAIPFTLHSQIEVAPPPVTSPIPTSEDPHTRMDRLEQKLRQMRASDGVVTWEDFDGAPVASLPAKFRMPEIERYTGIGCPRISFEAL